MTKTVQEVKFSISSILDKLAGNNHEPFSKDEYDSLVFALESNILFDNVAQKFLSSLKAIHEVPVLVFTGEETDEERATKQVEHDHLVQERDGMIKTVLLTVIKESLLRELRIRFGA